MIMDKYEKITRPSVAAPGQAAGNGLETSDSHQDCNTAFQVGQVAISDFLSAGHGNAVPLRHLETVTGLTGREIRRMISAERLAGVPILADNQTGYFLPATAAEVRRCVRSMRHRSDEIRRAAEAIAAATGEV